MRPRGGQQHDGYRNLDSVRGYGINPGREGVPWYWRVVAGGGWVMILGGFLMLPATFDSDPLLRVARSVVGIFAVALLTAGFSLTGLLAFAVRNPVFQADAIFLPSLTACILGLLTIFYDFLISSRFSWTTPALLLTIAAALSTVIYGGLYIWTSRKISSLRSSTPSNHPLDPNPDPASAQASNQPYQPPLYYENYVRNMYPTSSHPQLPPSNGYDPNSLTEEEMQRQQMLMLLLTRDQAPTPDPSQSTFHIDWQDQNAADEHAATPVNGYYAPHQQQSQPNSAFPQSALSGSVYSPRPGFGRQWTQERMRPWDGVIRGVTAQRGGNTGVRGSHEEREERRREIEMGYR